MPDRPRMWLVILAFTASSILIHLAASLVAAAESRN